jgi:hypothetical protein
MAKHLRIVPSQPGPFTLQYWRHTEQWQSLPVIGTIEEMARHIEANDFGLCAPIGQEDISPRSPRRGRG